MPEWLEELAEMLGVPEDELDSIRATFLTVAGGGTVYAPLRVEPPEGTTWLN